MSQLQVVLFYILSFVLFGCSPKYGIKKTYAYTRTITAGNIPVNDQGRPQSKGVQQSYLVYVEMKDTISKPQWDTAWIKKTAYSIQALKIGQKNIVIGKTAADQKEVVLTTNPGHALWQLLLTPLPISLQSPEIQNKLEGNKIVLTGNWEREKALYGIKEVIELERIFME